AGLAQHSPMARAEAEGRPQLRADTHIVDRLIDHPLQVALEGAHGERADRAARPAEGGAQLEEWCVAAHSPPLACRRPWIETIVTYPVYSAYARYAQQHRTSALASAPPALGDGHAMARVAFHPLAGARPGPAPGPP